MKGHWSRSAKHGVQFEVDTYDEVIAPTKAGIIAYLTSGQIKGIGPKTAEKIYSLFGSNTCRFLTPIRNGFWKYRESVLPS